MSTLLQKALQATSESKHIEFKRGFEGTNGEWCEILKDVFALANSGGGVILIGLDSRGQPTGADPVPFLRIDPVDITNKVTSYTADDFDGFEQFPVNKGEAELACLVVHESPYLLVPNKPGTYQKGDGSQGRAFSQGVVYVRRGAQSVPATTRDLQRFLGRKLKEQESAFLKGVRRVAKESTQSIKEPSSVRVVTDDSDAPPVRLTDNADAPEYRLVDPNQTHPFIAMEVVEQLKRRLPEQLKINVFDILAIRKVYGIDDRIEYSYKPDHGARTYSQAFVDRIVEKVSEDPHFLVRTRAANRRLKSGGVPAYDVF